MPGPKLKQHVMFSFRASSADQATNLLNGRRVTQPDRPLSWGLCAFDERAGRGLVLLHGAGEGAFSPRRDIIRAHVERAVAPQYSEGALRLVREQVWRLVSVHPDCHELDPLDAIARQYGVRVDRLREEPMLMRAFDQPAEGWRIVQLRTSPCRVHGLDMQLVLSNPGSFQQQGAIGVKKDLQLGERLFENGCVRH